VLCFVLPLSQPVSPLISLLKSRFNLMVSQMSSLGLSDPYCSSVVVPRRPS